jgi:hypothetical protein
MFSFPPDISRQVNFTSVFVPCSLIEIDRRFRDAYYSILNALTMEAISTSEMLFIFYHITRCYVPEDGNFQVDIYLLTEKASTEICTTHVHKNVFIFKFNFWSKYSKIYTYIWNK